MSYRRLLYRKITEKGVGNYSHRSHELKQSQIPELHFLKGGGTILGSAGRGCLSITFPSIIKPRNLDDSFIFIVMKYLVSCYSLTGDGGVVECHLTATDFNIRRPK